MNASSASFDAASLLESIAANVEDPRDPRGVRHPFSAIVGLALLGMLARIREMEVLVRWATLHWNELREPLGFDRDEPPVATTISRTLARRSLAEVQAVFLAWLRERTDEDDFDGSVCAVDGKTSKQALDVERPLHMLDVFVQDVRIAIGQWPVEEDKSNEPGTLRRRLDELVASWPALKLLTGDAIFAQRPLLEALQDRGIDYLFQIEANQSETRAALTHCFASAPSRSPDARTVEKKGASSTIGVCGSIWRTPTGCASRSVRRVAGSRSGSIANSAAREASSFRETRDIS